ncbi:Ldh family oxidoreductase [Gymnodinialimonas ceratoperidinii]|uniref:Ldh family oxidoreductase n=1 Tax=Gymnodinialimonas ceratoperidinii TaxID=2856823 RepID=A0A8F6YBJ8_9RHOB|nr:Ldh family oxidoreductase [Gymnodinialimonas ceratoperidinii]QXT38257.1 Ldh family oxidoreductase [Gymnodinialimonas ceratoperidinii]
MHIAIADIRAASEAALLAHGAGAFQAAEVAKAVARAEETGNIICGLYYLESYCTQLASGRVEGTVEPEISKPKQGVVRADARFGFAQPAFARALSQAVAAARDVGVATLTVAHAHTCTSLGYFTEQIAAEGLIAIGFTNASAIVAAPGGTAPVLGTNPIAMTIPGDDGPLMHADFSTSAVALGKITMAKAAGEKIPLGWAVDAEGQPTTDPEAAIKGALVSAAGPKGWAFGLLVEVMAAGLTGSVNSLDVKGLKLPDGKPHDLGQTYLFIDPDAHAGRDTMTARLRRVAEVLENDGGSGRIPGVPRRHLDPVDVPDALWASVQALAGQKTAGA